MPCKSASRKLVDNEYYDRRRDQLHGAARQRRKRIAVAAFESGQAAMDEHAGAKAEYAVVFREKSYAYERPIPGAANLGNHIACGLPSRFVCL